METVTDRKVEEIMRRGGLEKRETKTCEKKDYKGRKKRKREREMVRYGREGESQR